MRFRLSCWLMVLPRKRELLSLAVQACFELSWRDLPHPSCIPCPPSFLLAYAFLMILLSSFLLPLPEALLQHPEALLLPYCSIIVERFRDCATLGTSGSWLAPGGLQCPGFQSFTQSGSPFLLWGSDSFTPALGRQSMAFTHHSNTGFYTLHLI